MEPPFGADSPALRRRSTHVVVGLRKSHSLGAEATRDWRNGPTTDATVNKTACFKQSVPICMIKHGIARHHPLPMPSAGFGTDPGQHQDGTPSARRASVRSGRRGPIPGCLKVAVEEMRTPARAVKCLDCWETSYGESSSQACLHQSRTKVQGAKVIRYRCSLYCKRCRLGIGGLNTFPTTSPASLPSRNQSFRVQGGVQSQG